MRAENTGDNKKAKKHGSLTMALLGIFFVLLSANGASASSVTGLKDIMTWARVSMPSNHTVSFVASDGMGEGQTISIVWPIAFTAVGMNEDDVDIVNNGVQLTTASNCSGSEMAAAAWTGTTLTITICTGNGGAIPSGNSVEVRAGTNAINSGAGVHQLSNPALAGNERIDIGGTSGNIGSAIVAIVPDDSIYLSAGVGSSVTNAPVTVPGGSGMVQVPIISELVIDQITTSSARVSWKTDIVSNSYALYGPTRDHGAVSGSETLALDHSVTLYNLLPGLAYHVQARSVDAFGMVGLSTDRIFKTLEGSDIVAPVISNIRVDYIAGNEARVAWTTDKPTYSRVEFGNSTKYGSMVEDQSIEVEHATMLGNLLPRTAYHFRIIAIGVNGGQAVSDDHEFKTFDTVPPKIFGIVIENLTANSFDIIWKTNKPATGGVKFGTSQAYEGGEVIESTGFAADHRVKLSKLYSNTTYHFKIYQSDILGNDGESDDKTTTTLPLSSPATNQPVVNPPVTNINIPYLEPSVSIKTISQNVYNYAKKSLNKAECVFPWLLLLIIVIYLVYRFNKRKK